MNAGVIVGVVSVVVIVVNVIVDGVVVGVVDGVVIVAVTINTNAVVLTTFINALIYICVCFPLFIVTRNI